MSEETKKQGNKIAPVKKGVAIKKEPKDLVSVDVNTWITTALDKGLDVSYLEKLFDLKERVDKSAAQKKFNKALAEFQSICPIIEKKTPAYDKYGKIRYYYAQFDEIISVIKEPLGRCGFSYKFKMINESEKEIEILTTVTHEYGHSEGAPVKMPITNSGFMSPQQEVATAKSYAKRYGLCDVIGVATGDADDDTMNIANDQHRENDAHPKQRVDNKNNGYKKPPQSQPKQNKKETAPQTIDQPEKEKTRYEKFSDAPDKNRALFSTIMLALNETKDGKALFTAQQKIEYKKTADEVLKDYEAILKLQKAISEVVSKLMFPEVAVEDAEKATAEVEVVVDPNDVQDVEPQNGELEIY